MSKLLEYSKSINEPSESKDQTKKIKKFEQTIKWLAHWDEYYTIIDLKEIKIKKVYGLSKQLGSINFDAKNILSLRNLIHPFVRDWHSLLLLALLEGSYIDLFKFQDILKSRFIMNIPVRNKNNTYVFVKLMILPYQLDSNNKIVSYLNTYSIVDKYMGQPLRPRFFEGGIRRPKMEQSFLMYAARMIKYIKIDNFSYENFHYIHCYLTQLEKKEKTEDRTIANILSLNENTITQRKNSVLRKATKLFSKFSAEDTSQIDDPRNFETCLPNFTDSIEETIYFLHKSGILTILKHKFEFDNGEKKEFKLF